MEQVTTANASMSGIALHMSSPKRQKSLSAAQLRGIRLVAARKARGKGQQEIASELDVSRQTVSGWENGAEIEESRMEGVSRSYGATKSWIRYGEGAAPEGLTAFEVPQPTDPDEQPTSARRKKRG